MWPGDCDRTGGLGKIGREVQCRGEADGRKWHLEQRSSRNATHRRRSPWHWSTCSPWFTGLVASPTSWNNQASVEVIAPASTWFLHALTGEWLLELYFRVPSGTFDKANWKRSLA
jgi:hypothetical protein